MKTGCGEGGSEGVGKGWERVEEIRREEGAQRSGNYYSPIPASGDSMVTSVASPSPAEVEADTDTV